MQAGRHRGIAFLGTYSTLTRALRFSPETCGRVSYSDIASAARSGALVEWRGLGLTVEDPQVWKKCTASSQLAGLFDRWASVF